MNNRPKIIMSITLVETQTRMPHIKFEANWPINFRRDSVWIKSLQLRRLCAYIDTHLYNNLLYILFCSCLHIETCTWIMNKELKNGWVRGGTALWLHDDRMILLLRIHLQVVTKFMSQYKFHCVINKVLTYFTYLFT